MLIWLVTSSNMANVILFSLAWMACQKNSYVLIELDYQVHARSLHEKAQKRNEFENGN